MIQKSTATGDCWLAASSWQCACSRNQAHAVCLGQTLNHPGDSAPLQPRFGTLKLLAFPKTKITFESAEISDLQWDSGKYDRAGDGNCENCVRSQGAYFEGDWGVIVLCTIFLISSSINLYFSYYMAETFWTVPIHIKPRLPFWKAGKVTSRGTREL